MALRPRFNVDASMYTESYLSEIDTLKLRIKFFTEFTEMQKNIDIEENAGI
jgi:hypothetical protein